MFTKKETISIAIAVLVISASLILSKGINFFPYSLIIVFLVVLINILAKKISGFYFDSEIEIDLWQIKQYGFNASQHFKKPFPVGATLPLIFSAMSNGKFFWLASLTFDAKPKIYRVAKRRGRYKVSDMTEEHLGFIAAAGILANLAFAVIGYFLGFPEFSKLNVYYAMFNLIPLSNLDGNKIFFGNIVLWIFLTSITLIALFYITFML